MRDTRETTRSFRNNRFRRSEATIDTRPVFFIASEGKNTEPDYFGKILAVLYQSIQIVVLGEKKGATRGNDPKKLKQRIQEKLREQNYENIISPEAWVVVDRDERTWTIEQLNEVAMWAKTENDKGTHVFHGMALSNPCFEFWLLLHFEEGTGALNSGICKEKLKKHIQHYGDGKKLDAPKVIKLFTEKAVKEAIKRSEAKNIGMDEAWPRKPGHTTVHILVQRILNAAGNIPR